jgi:hypothetical protein
MSRRASMLLIDTGFSERTCRPNLENRQLAIGDYAFRLQTGGSAPHTGQEVGSAPRHTRHHKAGAHAKTPSVRWDNPPHSHLPEKRPPPPQLPRNVEQPRVGSRSQVADQGTKLSVTALQSEPCSRNISRNSERRPHARRSHFQ